MYTEFSKLFRAPLQQIIYLVDFYFHKTNYKYWIGKLYDLDKLTEQAKSSDVSTLARPKSPEGYSKLKIR